jgi:hypothetical protein
MTHILNGRTTVVVTALVILAAFAGQAHAQCSTTTVEGGYGFSISGTNFARNVPWAMVGRFVSDGKGAVTGKGTQSTRGEVSQATFTGQYEVREDCTGAVTFMFGNGIGSVVEFVIVDSGRRLEMIVASQGVLEVGAATKIVTTPIDERAPVKASASGGARSGAAVSADGR